MTGLFMKTIVLSAINGKSNPTKNQYRPKDFFLMGDKKNNAGITDAKLTRWQDKKDTKQDNNLIYFSFLFSISFLMASALAFEDLLSGIFNFSSTSVLRSQ